MHSRPRAQRLSAECSRASCVVLPCSQILVWGWGPFEAAKFARVSTISRWSHVKSKRPSRLWRSCPFRGAPFKLTLLGHASLSEKEGESFSTDWHCGRARRVTGGEVMMTHRFDCFYNHFWRNSVVIVFETLSSFLT